MKVKNKLCFTSCLGLLFQFACTHQLKPIEPRLEQQKNIHLLYEQDSIENFVPYDGFVINYNKNRKVPNYTIHRIVPDQLKDSNGIEAKRSNQFIIDPRLKSFSASQSDYEKSGYDRGHHVPAGDFVYNERLKNETFTYTNVSPQWKELNRYGWKYLEMSIRKKVKRCKCDAYVITGTRFKTDSKTIGKNKVGVPEQLYKVVFYPKKDRLYAFLMDNSRAKYQGRFKDYQLTVDELEELLELDFFENLDNEDEGRLEGQLKKFRK